MKVVFLDIDGVLNSGQFIEREGWKVDHKAVALLEGAKQC